MVRVLRPDPDDSPEEREWTSRERDRRDLEADRYDRLVGLRLFTPLERRALLAPLRVGPNERVAEIGCGTGRLTLPLLHSGGRVVAIDHSAASLARLVARAKSWSACLLAVQGDACRLPLADGWATAAMASGVLQHLASAERRRRAVREAARVLAPEGRAAFSLYRRLPLTPIAAADGRHSGEIPYHRFTAAEVRSLLQMEFHLERLDGRLLYVYIAHASRRPQETHP